MPYNIKTLIAELQKAQIRLELAGEQLKVVNAGTALIGEDMIKAIRDNKPALIAYIKAAIERNQAIPRLNDGALHYEVSAAQKSLLILSRFEEAEGAYNSCGAKILKGALQKELLEIALLKLIDRHEILRTIFIFEEGSVFQQQVLDPASLAFHIDYHDLRSDTSSEETTKKIYQECAQYAFDLSLFPLFRLALLQTDETTFTLIFYNHHILFDGWSEQIFLKELFLCYNSLRDGNAWTPEPLRIQYRDYAAWQNRLLANGYLDDQRAYWQEQFREPVAVLDLPVDCRRPSCKTYNGASVREPLPSTEILRYGKARHTTLYPLLLTAVYVLLHRYTSQEDMVVGTPVGGRERTELEGQIGYYVNTLPLRLRISGQHRLLEVLTAVKELTADAFSHSSIPFGQIIEALPIERNAARHPLFDVMVAYTQDSLDEEALQHGLEGITITDYETGIFATKFDLTFNFFRKQDQLTLAIEYNTDLFLPGRIRNIGAHFINILRMLIENDQRTIAELDFLDPEERKQLLGGFNKGKPVYTQAGTITDLFERQAVRVPGHTALVLGSQQMSYRELYDHSSRLAAYLLQQGMQAEAPVLVCMDRSFDMIISILGILQAGNAYVPVDPGYPLRRIAFIAQDSGARAVICAPAYRKYFEPLPGLDLVIEPGEEIAATAAATMVPYIQPHHLAYIIYTSGSTGIPKGVLIEHRSVISYITAQGRELGVREDDRLLQFSSFCFDASVEQIFLALLHGAALVLLPDEIRTDIRRLEDFLVEQQVTHLHATPGFLENIVPGRYGGLRRIVAGGEVCPVELPNRWNHLVHFYNKYGPTEATVSVLQHHCSADNLPHKDITPIGKPLPNTQVYILDQYGHPVPIGVTGEIYIGGIQVARGYLNRPDLDAVRFIPHPFDNGDAFPLYRTGDLARWLPGGLVAYMGRTDEQVKIRGYRIEPAEIELLLQRCDQVKQAAVIVKENGPDDKMLVAYIVPEGEMDRAAIFRYLQEQLPTYMVPSLLVACAGFPVTTSGKTDRRALSLLATADAGEAADDVAEPQNTTERILLDSWKKVLNRNRVGTRDNFFQSGGDSMKAIRLVADVNKVLNTRLRVRDLFSHQTIQALAAGILARQYSAPDRSIEQIAQEWKTQQQHLLATELATNKLVSEAEDFFPMSDIQRGLVFYSLLYNGTGIYHDQLYFQIEEAAFDLSLFVEAFAFLQKKHAILRTGFLLTDTYQLQCVHPAGNVTPDVELEDLSAMPLPIQKQYLQHYFVEDRKKFFDFSKPGGVWRARFFKLGAAEYGLLFSVHHVISDGWSMASLLTELSRLYFSGKNGEAWTNTSLAATYKDFVLTQLHASQQAGLKHFWRNYLAGYTRIDLPLHKKAVNSTGQEPAMYLFTLEAAELGLSAEAYNNLYARQLYLAAYCQLIRLLTNSSDITIGMITNGRPEMTDGDKILGCFLNTVPFRVHEAFDRNNQQYLEAIGQLLTESKHHEGLSLPEIAALVPGRHPGINPIFDITFNYLDFHIFDNLHASVKLTDPAINSFNKRNTLFDMIVYRVPNGHEISIGYPKGLYSSSELEMFRHYYTVLVKHLLSKPAAYTGYDTILSDAERSHILQDFNRPASAFPADKTAMALFDEQAGHWNDKVAVICEDRTMSYARLQQYADRTAACLQARYGIGPGDVVALVMQRSACLPVALMGILKAGACYLPLAAGLSVERMKYMLADSGCQLLLADQEYVEQLRSITSRPIVCPEQLEQEWRKEAAIPSCQSIDSHSRAYVMYTSGTTGKPKGVQITHRSLVNFLSSMARQPGMNHTDRLLALSGYTFDISLLELLLPLVTGGQLILATAKETEDREAFNKACDLHRPTIIQATPSMWSIILQGGWQGAQDLKILCGGEPLHLALAHSLLDKCGSLWNMYGPTETTIWSTLKQIDRNDTQITVGQAIANTRIYVLDSRRQPVPVGIEGDVYIAGEGIALGYVGQEALTREKFTIDPFSPGGRMYNTGDRGSWTAAGELVIAGRRDTQVKLRGHRIELQEIENNLVAYGLTTARVIVGGEGADRYLAAYYEQGEAVAEDALRDFLKSRLPAVMIPSFIIPIPKIPLTLSGKLDHRSLPDPKVLAVTADDLPEWDPIEQQVGDIFKRLLKIKAVTRLNDFFALGGNSLLAIQLVSQIDAWLKIRLSLRDIFDNSSVAALAALLKTKQPAMKREETGDTPEESLWPLSSMQRKFWLLSQNRQASAAYNLCSGVTISGVLDPALLQQAFERLIERHEILRTTFVWDGIEPKQKVHQPGEVTFGIVYFNLEQSASQEQDMEAIAAKEQSTPFDLDGDCPLFRVKLIQLSATQHFLLFTIHHIISDLGSMNIIFAEVSQHYFSLKGNSKATSAALPVQFRDYVRQEINLPHTDWVEYWKKEFQYKGQALRLPVDYPGYNQADFGGAALSFVIGPAELAAIQLAAQRYRCTSFMFLFTAINVLLNRYTSQQEIVLGTPVSARWEQGAQSQIGPYINTFPIRTSCRGEDSFADLLQQVREKLLKAFEGPGFPVELSGNRAGQGDAGHLFDIMVSYQLIRKEDLHFAEDGLVFEYATIKSNKSQFLLAIDFFEHEGSLTGVFNYNTHAFKEISLLLMKERLLSLLNQAIQHPHIPLGQYDTDLHPGEPYVEQYTFDY